MGNLLANPEVKSSVEKYPADLVYQEPATIEPLYKSIHFFSQKLFEASIEYADHKKNIVLSPYSLYDVIVATAMGARGLTREQIKQAISLNIEDTTWHEKMAKLSQEFSVSQPNVIKQTANELLLSNALPLASDYRSCIERLFQTTVRRSDFANPEVVRQEINERIRNITLGMIKELFPKGSIDTSTFLVISNALYFKGDWMYPFSKKELVRQFYIGGDQITAVPMMELIGEFKKASLPVLGAQALFLPYKDNRHGMLFVLPNERDGLQELERQLFASSFKPKDLLEKMNDRYLSITMPKFNIKFKANMVNILTKMGIVNLFDVTAADLSGISAQLAEIRKVVTFFHESVLEIDRAGTMASSATGQSWITISSALPEEFTFSHPFIFYLVDLENDSIPLFVGHVVDPLST